MENTSECALTPVIACVVDGRAFRADAVVETGETYTTIDCDFDIKLQSGQTVSVYLQYVFLSVVAFDILVREFTAADTEGYDANMYTCRPVDVYAGTDPMCRVGVAYGSCTTITRIQVRVSHAYISKLPIRECARMLTGAASAAGCRYAGDPICADNAATAGGRCRQ
jgi:hypothetical protein